MRIFAEPRRTAPPRQPRGRPSTAQALVRSSRHETSCMTRARILLPRARASAIAVVGLGIDARDRRARRRAQLPDHRRSSARTAQKAAEAGVPLSETGAERARHRTPSSAATRCGTSPELYLKSPWRWPELWGMNLEQVQQPAPDLSPARCCSSTSRTARARLRMGAPVGGAGDASLSPRVRPSDLDRDAHRRRSRST